MSSKVKIYSVRGHFDHGFDLMTTQKVVLASDYAALEAECANLKNSLLAITARHFAESWKKRTSDAELERYLSAGIAQLEAERAALASELDQAREEIEGMHKSLDKLRAQCAGFSAYAEIDRLTAELAAIKGQEVE